jgi:hypothetical protein
MLELIPVHCQVDINVSIRADIPNTKENNNLKLNFKVINNTSYNVKKTVPIRQTE